jgi:hypothetical protein
VELAEASMTHSHSAGGDGPNGEPSASSSLQHLVAGSQGVITKWIDLALLEGQELLSRSIERAALLGAGMVLAVAAWLAGAGALVLFVTPDAPSVIRLAAFGLLNLAGAFGLVTLATRHGRPPTRVPPNGNGPTPQREPLRAHRKS